MRKSLSILIALAALNAIAAFPLAASDLSLNSVITYSPGSAVSYNPTSVTAITVSITVKNDSSSDAKFFIAVDEIPDARKVSMIVNNIECSNQLYAMTTANKVIGTPASIGSTPSSDNSVIGSVRKGRTSIVKAKLQAKDLYYGPDGEYQGMATFSCYRYFDTGTPVFQFSATASVIYTVPSLATLTISNEALEFGQLTEGESLETTISVDASRPWDLYLQSQKGGCLQHATDIYSKVWYTLTIEGEDFGNLTNPTICYSKSTYSWWPWTGYDETLTMAVTIGEVPFGVEPGIYTDNIWLTIMTR
jgi:hypothetical protein